MKELAGKKASPQEISKAAGVHPYFIRGVMEQSAGYSLAEFRMIFERFFATDLALKTSGGKPVDLLERLVLEICGKGKK